jgi:hypothetical protein
MRPEEYVAAHHAKLMEDPERYVALLRRQNVLHCVWHLELQQRVAVLEAAMEEVAGVMESYSFGESASDSKLHRYADTLRKALNGQ